MMLANLLSKRRDAIVEAWIQLIVDAYPDDTSKVLRGVKDPFANPVGGTYRRAIPAIFDGLVAGETGPSESMLDLIRVRAVQQPEPARALGFVLDLRGIVREQLGREATKPEVLEELKAFDSMVEALLMSAFTCFVKCREKMYEIRVNEAKKQTAKLLERWNRMSRKQAEEE